MIRKVNISFEVDTETGDVAKVICNVEGQIKKKTTTKKKDEIMAPYSIIDREDNRLVLNSKAVDELGATVGDKLVITYSKVEDGKLAPMISVDDSAGNKLSKANTVPFRGKQNTVLAEYGDQFTIAPHKDGLFRLLPSAEAEISENISAEVIVNDNEPALEIEEIGFDFKQTIQENPSKDLELDLNFSDIDSNSDDFNNENVLTHQF